MRLSVDPTDLGYHPAAFGSKVFLDGVEISGVLMADEEKRLLVAIRYDEQGNVMLTPDREDIATETRYGCVRIELSEAMNRYLNGIACMTPEPHAIREDNRNPRNN